MTRNKRHRWPDYTYLVATRTRGLTITDPADVAAYRDAFARLRKLAVTGDDARALLRQIAG
jgi:Domain of unknown function (DUF5753)